MSKNIKNKIFIGAIFIILGFLAMQVPFSQIIGAENLKFSLFDFYGPIAGAFIGSVWGLITVFVMEVINWAVHGFAFDTGTMIRFFPMLFAVIYFAKQTRWTLVVPIIAMIAFWIHPEGRAAWYYALYWLIPLVAFVFYRKFIFARALGATFTAHSVGSVLFLWFFNLPASVWTGLIPVVWKERFLMAAGITITYIAFNYIFSLLSRKIEVFRVVHLHARFTK